MGRNDLAQNRDRWQALMNAVMNLPVSYNAGNISTDFLLASQEVLCSTKLFSYKYLN
jgi:hypothetical protein